MNIFPKGWKLNDKAWDRIKERLAFNNISSYSGLVRQYSKEKKIIEINYLILEKFKN